MTREFLINGPAEASRTLVLAHGAGAPMDSPFMAAISARLAAKGHRVVRFEFDYMAERRTSGRKRPPERPPALLVTWREVIADMGGPERVVIGGKSMGGRMASLIATELPVRGCVCLGYPFHPPGRPEKTRTDHLGALLCPTLIVQGTRDPFGTLADVRGYDLGSAIAVHWIEDGNHDLAPRKASGVTVDQALDDAASAVEGFLAGISL